MYTSTKPLTPRLKKIVYFAMVFSTFIYCFIVWFLFAGKAPSGTLQQELHRTDIMIFMFLTAFAFIYSLRLPANLTRWACAEAICIWGMMGTFFTDDWRLFAGGWALSLIGYALAFPSAEEQTTAP
jgi:hypothetical protein